MRNIKKLRIGFLCSILLLAISLSLGGCGMRPDAGSDAPSAGSLSRDGDFTAQIPSALQKHRQDEVLTATGLVDDSQAFEVSIDHVNERFTANIPNLSPGTHKFEIRFSRGGVLFATLMTNQEIIAGKDTPIAFDATSLVYAAPPKIDSTNPSDSQKTVDRSAEITVGFSQPLKGETVTSSTFTVSSAAGPLSGTVSYLETPETFEAIFTPDKSLALLTTYTVTILSGVSDVSGNVLPSDQVWTFKTADGAWSSAGLIETDNAGDAFIPQVTFDWNGNAIAVWYQWDGLRNNIWSNRFTAGTGWGTAELIETDNTGTVSEPAVAVDRSGNAIS